MIFNNNISNPISQQGEHKASRALKHAAEVIMDNPAALQVGPAILTSKLNASKNSQLRYLQTLSSISAENNSTIIFPVPVDILTTIITRG